MMHLLHYAEQSLLSRGALQKDLKQNRINVSSSIQDVKFSHKTLRNANKGMKMQKLRLQVHKLVF